MLQVLLFILIIIFFDSYAFYNKDIYMHYSYYITKHPFLQFHDIKI